MQCFASAVNVYCVSFYEMNKLSSFIFRLELSPIHRVGGLILRAADSEGARETDASDCTGLAIR